MGPPSFGLVCEKASGSLEVDRSVDNPGFACAVLALGSTANAERDAACSFAASGDQLADLTGADGLNELLVLTHAGCQPPGLARWARCIGFFDHSKLGH